MKQVLQVSVRTMSEFRFEKEMLQPVNDWCIARGLSTKAEFQVPWGICDLVGVAFHKERLEHRLSLGQRVAIGHPRRIRLLYSIPDFGSGRAVTIARLQREFADMMDASEVLAEIEYLKNRRFVVSVRRGQVQKLNGWMPLHKKVIAIELKLARYEEALRQSLLNRRFADESYVALPAERARRIFREKRAESAKDKGIGILAVTSESCEVLLPSGQDNSSLRTISQAHCAERFFRDISTSS